ncbi:MAG: NrpR regulatory domain-containing protein [Methanomicrobiales archaeon]|nr:NrpR regulatory domain-containing protein [Methanomicrobiales archaeon]
MSLIPSERKYLEILRILKEHREPIGAKRLSEMMAERGFVLTDRAVQYYLRYLDDMGFTEKVGNTGRVLTPLGTSETESALVDERIGFIISRLERLAFRTTFDPATSTGDVAYNLSVVPEEELERVCQAFDRVTAAGYGFFSSYRVLDRDPRIPSGHAGIVTICSITMDGVLQRMGVPVRMAFGGTLSHSGGKVQGFAHLIGYRGTSIDPLQLFISAGLTSIRSVIAQGTGMALANVREVPAVARPRVESMVSRMRKCGFFFPVALGTRVFNLAPTPYRLSIVSYSGLNLVGCGIEEGLTIRTEIGAGNIPFSKVMGATESS